MQGEVLWENVVGSIFPLERSSKKEVLWSERERERERDFIRKQSEQHKPLQR